eukprot:gene2827-4976_t
MKNVRLSVCVAGNLSLVPKELHVLETLQLLADRLGLAQPGDAEAAAYAAAAAAQENDADRLGLAQPGDAAAVATQEKQLATQVKQGKGVETSVAPHQNKSVSPEEKGGAAHVKEENGEQNASLSLQVTQLTSVAALVEAPALAEAVAPVGKQLALQVKQEKVWETSVAAQVKEESGEKTDVLSPQDKQAMGVAAAAAAVKEESGLKKNGLSRQDKQGMGVAAVAAAVKEESGEKTDVLSPQDKQAMGVAAAAVKEESGEKEDSLSRQDKQGMGVAAVATAVKEESGKKEDVLSPQDIEEKPQRVKRRFHDDPDVPAHLSGPPWVPYDHPLHTIEESLRNGGICELLAHLYPTLQSQATDDPARKEVNPEPKWDVPIELIEWQPVYHQDGLTGGHWAPNWKVTQSSKCVHVVKRLLEIGAGVKEQPVNQIPIKQPPPLQMRDSEEQAKRVLAGKPPPPVRQQRQETLHWGHSHGEFSRSQAQ